MRQALLACAPLVLGVTLVAAGAPMLIGGVLFSSKAVSLDLKRLNPFSGLKRLFSMQMIAELIKTLFKVCLVGGACGTALWCVWPRLTQGAPPRGMAESLSLISQCVLVIILALIPVVGFDILYQLFSHMKKLRMARHDIREEYKEQEGDPQLKSLIRKRQQAQRRMMQDVAKADVVILNPTHYAVVLKYEQMRMTAPRLLAKGAGVVALNIRQRAEQHRLPILVAPPLARAPALRNRRRHSGGPLWRRSGSAGLGLWLAALA